MQTLCYLTLRFGVQCGGGGRTSNVHSDCGDDGHAGEQERGGALPRRGALRGHLSARRAQRVHQDRASSAARRAQADCARRRRRRQLPGGGSSPRDARLHERDAQRRPGRPRRAGARVHTARVVSRVLLDEEELRERGHSARLLPARSAQAAQARPQAQALQRAARGKRQQRVSRPTPEHSVRHRLSPLRPHCRGASAHRASLSRRCPVNNSRIHTFTCLKY